MDEIAALLETQIPALRRYARALLRMTADCGSIGYCFSHIAGMDLREHQQTVARLVFGWLTSF